jgi:hypothetical protein
MFHILLLSVLVSSTCALPHGGGSLKSRDQEGVKDGVQQRGLFGDDEKQNCTGQSQLTQELAKGGLWGQPRDQRVNYINSHNDEDQDSPFVSIMLRSIMETCGVHTDAAVDTRSGRLTTTASRR